MVWYGMVWYGMVWYGTVWYGMVRCGMAWHGMHAALVPFSYCTRSALAVRLEGEMFMIVCIIIYTSKAGMYGIVSH